MENMLVTIVVPAYNHERYIANTFNSLLAIEHTNVELIVIDDGSADNTWQIVLAFEQRLRDRFSLVTLLTRPNRGISETLNQALEVAKGDYFCAVASDDLVKPNRLCRLLKVFNADENLAAVSGGIELISESGAVTASRVPRREYVRFEDVFSFNYSVYAPAIVFKTAILRKIGGYCPESKIEDWELLLRLTYAGYKLFTISEIVAQYRLHGANFHKKYLVMDLEMRKIAQRYSSVAGYQETLALLDSIKFRNACRVSFREAARQFPRAGRSFFSRYFIHGLVILFKASR